MTGNLLPNATIDEREWFRMTFGRAARERIESVFSDQNADGALDRALVGKSETVAIFLSDLLLWFDNPRDRDECAVPILRRLVALMHSLDTDAVQEVEQLHFIYQHIMQVSYKLRAVDSWLDVTRWAAQAQVAIADRVAAAMSREYRSVPLPAHRGYERLAILADKAGENAEVIRLCVQARGQGWEGRWDDRISKAQRRETTRP